LYMSYLILPACDKDLQETRSVSMVHWSNKPLLEVGPKSPFSMCAHVGPASNRRSGRDGAEARVDLDDVRPIWLETPNAGEGDPAR
jgi:hypothetical protein